MNQEKKDASWGCIIIAGIIVLLAVFMPKSGKFALLDIAMDVLGYFGIATYLLLKLKEASGELQQKILIIIGASLVICQGIWNTKNLK